MESAPPVKPDPADANLERILSALRPGFASMSRRGDKWTEAVYASIEQNDAGPVRESAVRAHLPGAEK